MNYRHFAAALIGVGFVAFRISYLTWFGVAMVGTGLLLLFFGVVEATYAAGHGLAEKRNTTCLDREREPSAGHRDGARASSSHVRSFHVAPFFTFVITRRCRVSPRADPYCCQWLEAPPTRHMARLLRNAPPEVHPCAFALRVWPPFLLV